MRLIDADVLLEAIHKIYGANNAPQGIINLIINAPTIQREGWVSVEDRLPDENKKVLVIGESGIALARFGNFEDSWDGEYNCSAEGYGHDGCDGKFVPTHWQPLPAAPTDKE